MKYGIKDSEALFANSSFALRLDFTRGFLLNACGLPCACGQCGTLMVRICSHGTAASDWLLSFDTKRRTARMGPKQSSVILQSRRSVVDFK
jgi:hypothetical protein